MQAGPGGFVADIDCTTDSVVAIRDDYKLATKVAVAVLQTIAVYAIIA